MIAICGIILMFAFAYALSTNRRAISWSVVGSGIFLQILLAVLILKTQWGRSFFEYSSSFFLSILQHGQTGAQAIFGSLASSEALKVQSENGLMGTVQIGAYFAFGVLPTIVFFSAFSAVLYHIGILQFVIRIIARVLRRFMGLSAAESLAVAANVFVGQTEAPLLVRPYLRTMTQSELMAMMAGGFATVAGGVFAAYIGMLSPYFPDIAGHLLTASLMSAPAAIVFAKVIVPSEAASSFTAEEDVPKISSHDVNLMDAATRGTSEGLMLALNVGAMLIAFTALVSILNAACGSFFGLFGYEQMNLQSILGTIFSPLAFLLGTPWSDAQVVGELMATKTVLNEFLAYIDLRDLLAAGVIQHEKSTIIATYALCGFSNFASIGIQIGGLTTLIPERRSELARLGFRAMLAGSFACFQTAALAALLTEF